MQRGKDAIGRAGVGTYRAVVRARNRAFSTLVAGSFEAFGRRSVLQLPVRLDGEARIAIGSGVFVGAGSWLQTIVTPAGEGRVRIGDGTSIAGACVLSSAASITVGERVLFARNVYVADHRHAFGDHDRAILDQGLEQLAPVVIGDGAWLGQNVVVGPGVRIGRGAVVGAGSVVLSDVPDRSVAVGSPARISRTIL